MEPNLLMKFTHDGVTRMPMCSNWKMTVALAVIALVFTGCPPTYPLCASNDQCRAHDEVCVNGQCVACATDDQCKRGFSCIANKCAPAACGPNRPCEAGKSCVADKCVTSTGATSSAVAADAGTSCSVDTDCSSGEACVAGTCAASAAISDSGKCSFEPIHFAFNEYIISSTDEATLTNYATCIKQGALRFVLEGHSDVRGTEEFNMALSQKRAASVKKFLTDLGVSNAALDTVGYGELRPAISGDNEAAWTANRRVEFKKR